MAEVARTHRPGAAGETLAVSPIAISSAARGVVARDDAARRLETVSDAEFFLAHEWCLNPIQSIGELRSHIGQVWELLGKVHVPWQKDECAVNLYLLCCALSCTADDYLSYMPHRFGAGRRSGLVGRALSIPRFLANVPYSVATSGDKTKVRRWRVALEAAVAAVCAVLIDRDEGLPVDWSAFEALLPAILEPMMPKQPKDWRMRVPEAYRCQDMTHHDVIQMARNYAEAYGGRPPAPVFIIGPRTAGSYFVPLVKGLLERRRVEIMGAVTIRPKEGLSRLETKLLRNACERRARIVIVDDHPNSGHTFRLILSLLQRLGGAPENMVILAPDHQAQADWIPSVHPVPVVELAEHQFHKSRILSDEARLLECIGMGDSARFSVRENADLEAANRALSSHYPDNFQVRQKRVFEVEGPGSDSDVRIRRVFAKSVGWGWLGYHAYLAGTRLARHVPRVLALRDGILFMDWCGALKAAPVDPAAVASVVPAYIADRVRLLPLPIDPTEGAIGYRVSGRDRILNILRQPYGRVLKNLARGALDARHARFAPPLRTLVDGQMSLENWIQGDDGLRKVDFEHHNFGGAEEDFVDPAYDLAGAIHALGLDGLGEDQLLDEYIRRTGDGAVRERLIVYKLRLGLRELDRAAGTLERPLGADRHRVADRRFLAAREFLNRHVSVHNSRRIETPSAPQWSERLIALDLDGVFDSQVLGYFPHTTPAALGALALLRAYGYCVVVNSGRSVDEVRLFCETYGLAGGFAEYGSIFIDRVAQREEILFGADVEKELRRCRALLAQRANWYCDPGYGAAIRAYGYAGPRWIGLDPELITAIMSEGQFQAIEVIDTPASTYFVPKGHDKGSAIAGLAARIGLGASWIAGVGDSDQDKPMLEQVDLGFAVGNASPNLKALARSAAHVHLMAKPQQQGLLQAVVHLLVRREGLNADVAMRKARSHVKPSTHPLDLALEALDGSSLDRLRTVLGSLSR